MPRLLLLWMYSPISLFLTPVNTRCSSAVFWDLLSAVSNSIPRAMLVFVSRPPGGSIHPTVYMQPQLCLFFDVRFATPDSLYVDLLVILDFCFSTTYCFSLYANSLIFCVIRSSLDGTLQGSF